MKIIGRVTVVAGDVRCLKDFEVDWADIDAGRGPRVIGQLARVAAEELIAGRAGSRVIHAGELPRWEDD